MGSVAENHTHVKPITSKGAIKIVCCLVWMTLYFSSPFCLELPEFGHSYLLSNAHAFIVFVHLCSKTINACAFDSK